MLRTSLRAAAVVGVLMAVLTPAALASSPPTPAPSSAGDVVLPARPQVQPSDKRLAAAAIAEPGATDQPVLRPIHYTVVRVDFPDAAVPGDIATDAQVTDMAARSARFWAGVRGFPHVTFDVVHAKLSFDGPALPDLNEGIRADVEQALGRPVDGLAVFYRQGYPFPHYSCRGVMGGRDISCFGSFPLDQEPPAWMDLAHEAGHNLGLCEQTVDGGWAVHDRQYPSRWTPPEFTIPTSYGNPFSIMGEGSQAPSAPCQIAAGVLHPSAFHLMVNSHLYDINGPRGVRDLQVTAGGHLWTLEFRPHQDQFGNSGVALYNDGRIVETRSLVFTLALKKNYNLGGHRVVRVLGYGTYLGARYAKVYLGRG